MDGSSWAWLIAAALITGFGAFYLLTHATKRLKAGELAAISYQETIMASLLGLFLFGETMTAFQVIGGAFDDRRRRFSGRLLHEVRWCKGRKDREGSRDTRKPCDTYRGGIRERRSEVAFGS